MRRLHVITEGAILLAIFLVLMLFTNYAPIIGSLLHFVLPLPFLLFAIRHKVTDGLLLFFAGCILSLLFGSITNILLVLIFGLSGLIMGISYKRNQPIGALIVGSLTYTISLLLAYIGTIVFLKIDLIKDTVSILEQSMLQSKSILTKFNSSEELTKQYKQLEQGIELIPTISPTIFVATAISFAVLTHVISMPILRRLRIKVQALTPFREWKLPLSIVWYYLIVSILLIFNPDKDSFYFMAIINLYIILQIIILIQGYSFVFYYCYIKGLSKSIPVIIVIVSLLLPLLLYIIRILGIIDISFPLRSKISKGKM
ncbi:YybS family protein [Metabacillus litoralis]|uniref:YybS family protein n=1 Tax=Metabacillus litoralis TaxID=152268 RepID=UPI001CFF2947|nr:YybS family protein [Metabacillus litoralis]